MIEFIECQVPGYKARTLENAKADVTIAIAVDYTTAGEKCTKNCVSQNGKLYIALPYNSIGFTSNPESDVVEISNLYLNKIAKDIFNLKKKEITLNIAGNGIYHMPLGQKETDWIIRYIIAIIFGILKEHGITITQIQSGGQSGIDESGLKAAVKLGIPAKCIAPNGWLFRDENGVDIADEAKFKCRFSNL